MRLRYENGCTSFIEALDSERSLFDAELSSAQTRGTLFQALMNLYKAMGGGWVVEAEKMAVPKGTPASRPAPRAAAASDGALPY